MVRDIQESGEMYLETIFILKKRKPKVRSIDVVRELDFSKPSVSRAVNKLKDDGYIEIDERGYIELTASGTQIAQDIYEKHKTLTEFFVKVAGVTAEIAEEDACRIEHVISDETFEGLKKILAEKTRDSNQTEN